MKTIRRILVHQERLWLLEFMLERGADPMVCCDSGKNIMHDLFWSAKADDAEQAETMHQAMELVIDQIARKVGAVKLLSLLLSADRHKNTPLDYIKPMLQPHWKQLLDRVVARVMDSPELSQPHSQPSPPSPQASLQGGKTEAGATTGVAAGGATGGTKRSGWSEEQEGGVQKRQRRGGCAEARMAGGCGEGDTQRTSGGDEDEASEDTVDSLQGEGAEVRCMHGVCVAVSNACQLVCKWGAGGDGAMHRRTGDGGT